MINLEAAQAVHDEAVEKIVWCQPPSSIRRAMHVLQMLIDENRRLRDNQRALTDTSNYALPGGQRQ